MPAVWERTVRLYQVLWERVGQAFCDGCGMVIKDSHYYKWEITRLDEGLANKLPGELMSHTNHACVGRVLLDLLSQLRCDGTE